MFLRRLQKLIYEVFELWSSDLLTCSCRYLNLWNLLSCRITFFSFFWLVTFLVTAILQLSGGELKDIYLTYVRRQITLLLLFSFFWQIRWISRYITRNTKISIEENRSWNNYLHDIRFTHLFVSSLWTPFVDTHTRVSYIQEKFHSLLFGDKICFWNDILFGLSVTANHSVGSPDDVSKEQLRNECDDSHFREILRWTLKITVMRHHHDANYRLSNLFK